MADSPLVVRVECDTDLNGEVTPRRFFFDDRGVAVREVLDQWAGQDYRYFKLLGSDEALYILRHDESKGEWQMVMYAAEKLRYDLRRL